MNLIDAQVIAAPKANRWSATAKGLGQIEIPQSLEARGDRDRRAPREAEDHGQASRLPANVIKLAGKVRDVAYYGDTSHVVVTVKGRHRSVGQRAERNVASAAPASSAGQEIWVSWAPEDTLVLTE